MENENNKEMEHLDQPEMTNEAAQNEKTESQQTTEQTVEQSNEQSNEPTLEEKYEELNDQYLRLYADFDNYRKKMARERADLLKTASQGVLVNILPVVDNFERALKTIDTATDMKAVGDGVQLIYQQLLTFLKQQGVEVIETEKQPFDTEFHEAITTISAPTEELKGKVIDCTQKGYKLYDKVIRYAKVVVGE